MSIPDIVFDRQTGIFVGDKKVTQRIVRHSPTGMNWGYGGSGPGDTALNVLLALGLCETDADNLYMAFKWDFIAEVPMEGGIISGKDVQTWLEEHLPVVFVE